MPICPNCKQQTFPDDVFCGNCGYSLGVSPPVPSPPPPMSGASAACPTCGRVNEPDASFCEIDGTPLSRVSVPLPPVAPSPMVSPVGPIGILVMPDQTEATLPQTTRVFGRSDLIRFLKPENAKEVSRAHFTIAQEGGSFYIQDGGPDSNDPQTWKASVNHTSVNGVVLQPGAKQRLNNNDVIDVAQLGINLTFKTR